MVNGSSVRGSNVFSTIENPFLKRFENVSADCVYGISAAEKLSEIKRLLAEAELGEDTDTTSRGAAGYTYMEFSLARAAAASLSNAAKFAELIEEKYRSAIAVSGGNSAAKWALDDVQYRIDELINSKESEKIDFEIYNKCAECFTRAFGTDISRLSLTEDGFNGLFGKIDATEVNYSSKCSERARAIWQRYDELKDFKDGVLKKAAASRQRDAADKAFTAACGNSYADIESLLTEVGIIKG